MNTACCRKNLDRVETHKTRSRGGGFFSDAYLHTQYYGRQLDNFFRANGAQIRDEAMMVVPLLAPENPALASAADVVGQGVVSYSQFCGRLDQAS